ncbi:MAG: glycosyltransferase family 9 protein, partial [Cetobacterium sp.]
MNIVLNHRASSEPRSLTLEQLKDLSLKLINLNKDIIVHIISVPSEYEILKDLVNKLDKENIKLLPKTEGIGEAAGLLKYSDMLVSVDTGLIHIASVYNIPIVGIYPLTENSAKLFEPKSERYEIVRGTKSGYTIEGVSLDKVAKSVNKILEESVYDKRCVV